MRLMVKQTWGRELRRVVVVVLSEQQSERRLAFPFLPSKSGANHVRLEHVIEHRSM